MKPCPAILAFALAYALACAPAAAARARCPGVPAPVVTLRIVDPGPRVVSTRSLQQINAKAGSHGLLKKGMTVLGMTEIKLSSTVHVNFRGMQSGGVVCVHVSEVEVGFGLGDHVVHVPREYPRGSCKFNVVMRHEMAHVDVNRRTVRKYAEKLKNELLGALRRTGAVAAPSMDAGQAAQTRVIDAVIQDISGRFTAEREGLHAAIDKPGGAYAAAGKCRGW